MKIVVYFGKFLSLTKEPIVKRKHNYMNKDMKSMQLLILHYSMAIIFRLIIINSQFYGK